MLISKKPKKQGFLKSGLSLTYAMLEISDQKYLETYVFINIWQEMKKEICSFVLKKGFIPKNAS